MIIGMKDARESMPLHERIGHVIKRAEQALISTKDHALRATGLTVPQYAALLAIAEGRGLSAAETARRCMVTPQTMSITLRNLENKRLVVRSPSPDHAKVRVTKLSAAGRRLLSRADRFASGVEGHLADGFSHAEREQLFGLLERAIDRLDEFRRTESP